MLSVETDLAPALIVTPDVPAFPEIENVHTEVKFFPLTLADPITTDIDPGEKLQPALEGVSE